MAKKRVLITGASGTIGTLIWKNLGDKYEFSGLNRRPVSGLPCLQASIANFPAIMPAFEGIDSVIHLSAENQNVQLGGKRRDQRQGTVQRLRGCTDQRSQAHHLCQQRQHDPGARRTTYRPTKNSPPASSTRSRPLGTRSITGPRTGPSASTGLPRLLARYLDECSPVSTASR